VRTEPLAQPPRAPKTRPWVIALQVLASGIVLALLLREAQPHQVGGALSQVSWAWLGLALGVKVAALTLHELRLWWLLRGAHPCNLLGVLGIGYLSGLVNFLLPVRAGDLLAMLLLRREQGVPTPIAVSAVGLVALLEAAALGLFLLGIFGGGLVFWEEAFGAKLHGAVSLVAVVTLGGVVVVIGLGVVGRLVGRRRRQDGPRGSGAHLLGSLALALDHAGGSLGRLRAFSWNVGLALVDVALFLATYAILLRALDLPVATPWFAAGVLMALGAVASIVLPPGLGAGTAAASVAGLALFGVDEPRALAYAALVWIVGNLPTVVLGLPPALRRLRLLAELFRRPASPSSEPGPPRG
jgi:uncharacterized membrane protein YbhN (UPF0104 family)